MFYFLEEVYNLSIWGWFHLESYHINKDSMYIEWKKKGILVPKPVEHNLIISNLKKYSEILKESISSRENAWTTGQKFCYLILGIAGCVILWNTAGNIISSFSYTDAESNTIVTKHPFERSLLNAFLSKNLETPEQFEIFYRIATVYFIDLRQPLDLENFKKLLIFCWEPHWANQYRNYFYFAAPGEQLEMYTLHMSLMFIRGPLPPMS